MKKTLHDKFMHELTKLQMKYALLGEVNVVVVHTVRKMSKMTKAQKKVLKY